MLDPIRITTRRKPNMAKLSEEAGCIELNPSTLIDRPKYYGTLVMKGYPQIGKRTFTPAVGIFGESLWCDTITGTLYKQTGECMSSDSLSLDPVLIDSGEPVTRADIATVKKV